MRVVVLVWWFSCAVSLVFAFAGWFACTVAVFGWAVRVCLVCTWLVKGSGMVFDCGWLCLFVGVVWLFLGGCGLRFVVGFGGAFAVCWLRILFVMCLVVLYWVCGVV